MAKLISIILCLSMAGYAFGIDCFQCKTTEKCQEESEMIHIKCGKAIMPNFETNCVKKVFEDAQTKAVTIFRSCVVIDPKKPNAHCEHKDPKSKLVSCDVCKEDFCNSSSSITLNMYAVIGATFSILFTKYFL